MRAMDAGSSVNGKGSANISQVVNGIMVGEAAMPTLDLDHVDG